jgi:hypothetical protein
MKTRDELQTIASAEQAARTLRAATTYDKYTLTKIDNARGTVDIDSPGDLYYTVNVSTGSCSCEDAFNLRRKVNPQLDAAGIAPIQCKHVAIAQLLLHQNRHEVPAPKPQVEIIEPTEAEDLNGAEIEPYNPAPSVGAIFFDARCRKIHPVEHARAMNYAPETIAAVRLAYEANRHQTPRPVSELLNALA